MWYWYGVDPYHFRTMYYGKCMVCCQIRSNPIVKSYMNYMLNENCDLYGLIWKVISHTKSIYNPHQGHRSCHTISILGPYLAHIINFGKGMNVNSYIFLQIPTVTSHFPTRVKARLPKQLSCCHRCVLKMAECEQVDEQDSSVVSTVSNSLEAVASTSNASVNHPNVSTLFPLPLL